MEEKEEKKVEETAEDFNKSKFRIKVNEEESNWHNPEDYGMCLTQWGWM